MGQSKPAAKTEALQPKKQEIEPTPSQLTSRRSGPVIEEQTGQIGEPTVTQSSGRISESTGTESTGTESTDRMNKSVSARPEEQKKESVAEHSTDWGQTPDEPKSTGSGKPTGIRGFLKKAITSLKQAVNPNIHDDNISAILEEIERESKRESNKLKNSMQKLNKQQEVALQDKIMQINKVKKPLNKHRLDSDSKVHEHTSISKKDMRGEITKQQTLRKSTIETEHALGKDSVTATNQHAKPDERRIENASATNIKGLLKKDLASPDSKNNKKFTELYRRLSKMEEGLNKHETHQRKHETPKNENHHGSGRSIISNQKPNNSQTPRKKQQGHSNGTGGTSSKGSYTLKPGKRITVSYKGNSGRSGGSSSGRKHR
ncbi:hypothetical protein KHA94_22825 [Bacillus sp. FJAT-49705]|uniref:Uncharacterized protein n=1 Tax=Cytobacillus citreus TaxID=2833586 RepID=A0ABS5NYN3_9BACI|nr:hypothetical protein [Cytobacillus citreus]MBS4192952.1 hypothetical protein [Cytobacillus citreus]